MRFNLIKNGLISSLFCSKLAKYKIESYLNEFLQKFRRMSDVQASAGELEAIIDILFYFYRKHNRIGVQVPGGGVSSSKEATTTTTTTTTTQLNSYYDPDDEATSQDDEQQQQSMTGDEDEEDETTPGDELLRLDLVAWIKTLACLLVNHTEYHRANATTASFPAASLLHFDSVYFVLEHLLRAPDCAKFAHLFHFPLVSANMLTAKYKLDLHSSKSDPLVNLYFDGYLRLIVPFARYIKQRDAFLFLSKSRIENFKRKLNKQADKCWQFIDLEGIYTQIHEKFNFIYD